MILGHLKAAMGKVCVKLGSDSMFFNHNVPIEIRDSQMRLVHQSGKQRDFKLPEGLYQISAVLEDGRKHHELVHIKADTPMQVVLGAQDVPELVPAQLPAPPRAPAASRSAPPDAPARSGAPVPDQAPAPAKAPAAAHAPAPVYQRPQLTKRSEAFSMSKADQEPVRPTQFIESHGASLLRETHSMWHFQCDSSLTEVASAVFQIDGKTTTISLPISPELYTPSGACTVKIEENRSGSHAHAWIAPQRTVANAMQNMLSSGYILEAASVADEAVDLLRDKYQDPTGAVLGALILHKTGQLKRLQGWVRNLATDFDWLPDGKVLLATTLYEDPSTQDDAMELALAASKQRILFSENLSLLLDLLRRYPGESYRAERTQAIETLASINPFADWESICLSYGKPEEYS